TGTVNGLPAAGILNLPTGDIGVDFLAVAPTDSSTMQLPGFASSIRSTAHPPRFTYTLQSQDLIGTSSDAPPGSAAVNPLHPATPAVSKVQTVPADPMGVVSVPVTVTGAGSALPPPLGLMIVAPDNANGAAEAGLIPVTF